MLQVQAHASSLTCSGSGSGGGDGICSGGFQRRRRRRTSRRSLSLSLKGQVRLSVSATRRREEVSESTKRRSDVLLSPCKTARCFAALRETERRSGLVCRAGFSSKVAADKSESGQITKEVREKVERGVESLKYEVTVGDVASTCGISLLEAERALQALAIDSSGTLSVTGDGEILYKFRKNFRSLIRSKSLAIRLEPAIEKTKSTAAWLVRIGFGTTLLASIVIVFAAILVVISSSRNDRDNRGSYRSSGPSFFISPLDFYYPYWDPYYYRTRQQRLQYGEEMNTLEAIFSFVFGDGNQNDGLEDLKWEAIGQIIRKSKGVVTAEQLAPFMIGDAKEEDADNPLEKESFVLPVLQKFDGRPEVDELGNIVYSFPELQKTAASTRSTSDVSRLGYLQEKKWKLTNASVGQVASAVGFGLINTFGIVTFARLIANSGMSAAQMAQIYGGVVSLAIGLLPFLKVYAAGFFAIPLVRWLLNRNTNKEIDARNARRMLAFEVLQQMSPDLRTKLQSARRFGGTKVVSDRGAVFTSDGDVEEMAMDDFDRKLREK